METTLDRKYHSVEAPSQKIRTRENTMHSAEVIFSKYSTISSSVSFESGDSTKTRYLIVNDDDRSAIFQELLFKTVATRVLRKNKKLFEELAKY